MPIEVSHRAAADVIRELIRRIGDVEHVAAVNLRVNHPEAGRHVGPGPWSTAGAVDGHRDDDISHHIHHGVVAEIGPCSKKAGTHAKDQLSAGDAIVAHSTGVHAKPASSVLDLA